MEETNRLYITAIQCSVLRNMPRGFYCPGCSDKERPIMWHCGGWVFEGPCVDVDCIGQKSPMPGHYPPAAASIQNDIDILNSTSRSWGLRINREKCAVLRFSRCYKAQVPPYYSLDGSPLPVCKSHLDLGVIVDVNLKFHEHVASVARKAPSRPPKQQYRPPK